MSDYTPTTEFVRERYLTGRRKQDPGDTALLLFDEIQAEFDRWLELHDREVAAKTVEEMVTQIGDPIDRMRLRILAGRIRNGDVEL